LTRPLRDVCLIVTWRLAAAALALGLAGGCATAPIVRVGDGPPPDRVARDEQWLLEEVRREIALLEERGALYDDPALEAYLNEVGQKMVPAGRAEPGITYRFRVIRDPALNAFAYPTGDIFVHTGLLARLRTEGELADVLGHEASHVYSRDTLYRFADVQQKTIAWKVTDLVLTPALTVFGFGGYGELGLGLIYATSVTGYSRHQEARADLDGLAQMEPSGYDPREGIRAEDRFLQEHDTYRQGLEIFFLASHPNTRWRKAAKEEWLRQHGLDPTPPPPDDASYLAVTAGVRKDNARMNLTLGRYHHALDDVTMLLEQYAADAEAWALVGDAHAKMAQDPKAVEAELSDNAWAPWAKMKAVDRLAHWRQKAEEAYGTALSHDPGAAEAERGLGLLLATDGDRRQEAVTRLERYLALRPEARDRRYVTSQLERLSRASATPAGDP